MFFTGGSLAFAQQQDVSRADFVQMMARSQPGHPMIPANAEDLSPNELFQKTADILRAKGFKVLKGKQPSKAMSQEEFVRTAYAFTGESPDRSLFEQKLFLKEKGLLSTADIGLTTGLEGKVLQIHKGDASGSDLKLASPVFMNDRFKTSGGSRALFTFDDKSSLTLGENASVRISKHVYNPETSLRQTVVNVSSGMVRFVVSKAKGKGSMFKVVTPTATAGVRGTEFVVVVKPDGETQFVGIENEIVTAPILPNGEEGEPLIVGPGQSRKVDKNRVATEVIKASPGLIGSLQKQTNAERKVSPDRKVDPSQANKTAKGKWMTKVAVKNLDKTAGKKGRGNLGVAGASRGDAVKAARGVGKDSAKLASRRVAKNAAKGAAKGAARSATKNEIKTAARQAAKSSAQQAATQVARNIARQTSREIVAKISRGIAKSTALVVGKSEARSSAKNAAKQAGIGNSNSNAGGGGKRNAGGGGKRRGRQWRRKQQRRRRGKQQRRRRGKQ